MRQSDLSARDGSPTEPPGLLVRAGHSGQPTLWIWTLCSVGVGQRLAYGRRGGSEFTASNGDAPSLVNDPADAREKSSRAGKRGFGIGSGGPGEHFLDGDGSFLDEVSQIARDPQDGVARDAVQERVGELGSDDPFGVEKQEVRRSRLLDLTVRGEQDLVCSELPGGSHGRTEGHGVVCSRLDHPEPRRGPRGFVLDRHRQRVGPVGEIVADGAGQYEQGGLGAGAGRGADVALRADEGRPDIERAGSIGNRFDAGLDNIDDGLDENVGRRDGEDQGLRGLAQPSDMSVESEDSNDAVDTSVRLASFETGTSVVQDMGRGMQRERFEGDELVFAPRPAFPSDDCHVVDQRRPERGRRGHRLWGHRLPFHRCAAGEIDRLRALCQKWLMENRSTLGKVARNDLLRSLAEDIGDWSEGSGPLYRLLATAIARAVERGAVARGARLPAERPLARALSLSRGTVVAAYDQLAADGFIERRRGSGTYATGPADLALPSGREGSALVARLVDRSAAATEVVDLSISVLHGAGALPPVGVTAAEIQGIAPDNGYSPWGLAGLRASIADLLHRWGLPSRAEEIVVTTGAQQAISIAASCWVRPGDVVVLDDPTYPGAVSAFTAAGARLLGVPLDSGGIQVSALRAALAERPALVYLHSTLHSPTGIVMADGRRRAIASLLTEARIPLVEDIALAGLAWSPPTPPVAAYASEQPIAVVGSLSKMFWGGLRLGFVRAPEPVALRFARVKATHDLGSSVASQMLGDASLRSPFWTGRLAARNDELQARCRLLASLLQERLGNWRWTEPEGGLSLWVQLPRPDARSFSAFALRYGVAVATADALSVTQRHADCIRLSFAPPPDVLRKGVDRLAMAWSNYHP